MTFSRMRLILRCIHTPYFSSFLLSIHPSSFNGMIDIARLRVRAKGAPFHGRGAKRELHAATYYMASRRIPRFCNSSKRKVIDPMLYELEVIFP